eukprot:TRINITY_DN12370_c0_g1_i1.p1 TRINITY_DN12370_c0_g1~~TRINITY_DN12370_c0_g1_i1.p1  ORF type:complete len:208 (+),score=7.71 TRINITY_DN12370_c0_g1_i1:84-626(+)
MAQVPAAATLAQRRGILLGIGMMSLGGSCFYYSWQRQRHDPTFRYWTKFNDFCVDGAKKNWLELNLKAFISNDMPLGLVLVDSRKAATEFQALSTISGLAIGGLIGYSGLLGFRVMHAQSRFWAGMCGSWFFGMTAGYVVPMAVLMPYSTETREDAIRSFMTYLRQQAPKAAPPATPAKQ